MENSEKLIEKLLKDKKIIYVPLLCSPIKVNWFSSKKYNKWNLH